MQIARRRGIWQAAATSTSCYSAYLSVRVSSLQAQSHHTNRSSRPRTRPLHRVARHQTSPIPKTAIMPSKFDDLPHEIVLRIVEWTVLITRADKLREGRRPPRNEAPEDNEHAPQTNAAANGNPAGNAAAHPPPVAPTTDPDPHTIGDAGFMQNLMGFFNYTGQPTGQTAGPGQTAAATAPENAGLDDLPREYRDVQRCTEATVQTQADACSFLRCCPPPFTQLSRRSVSLQQCHRREAGRPAIQSMQTKRPPEARLRRQPLPLSRELQLHIPLSLLLLLLTSKIP